MKKSASLICLLCLLVYCGPKQAEVERIIEDGVEVVLNHLEPYRTNNDSSVLELNEIFVIDLERKDLAEQGLAEIRKFLVDSDRNIYICQAPRQDSPLIFKFDDKGDFITAFGVAGQGPGEIQGPDYLPIVKGNQIPIINRATNKLMFFSSEGELLHEQSCNFFYSILSALILKNGNALFWEAQVTEGFIEKVILSLYDAELNKIKDILSYEFPWYFQNKINIFADMPAVTSSDSQIFIGYEKRSEDIFVYDLEGNLTRRIRKESKPIPTPKEKFEYVLEITPQDSPELDKLFAPKYMPIFQYFFTDDIGRLYVMTPMKSNTTGQNIFDIYSPEGIFISQKALGFYDKLKDIYEGQVLEIKSKNNRLYCLREKESGYKELVVYEMVWQ